MLRHGLGLLTEILMSMLPVPRNLVYLLLTSALPARTVRMIRRLGW